jgi:multidrug efflux pump subunit AcrB
LSIDRDAASRLGITASTIDNTLYAFGQRPIAQLFTRLSQYYVIEQVDPHFQLGPDALKRIYIASQTAGMVPLSELATLHSTTAPLAVNNQGQFPSVTISFNLKGNAPLGPAEAAVEKTVAALHPPPTIETGFHGNAQTFQASLSSEPVLILAALVAVYIILGMLYENLVHPLTIISTLPGGSGRPVDLVCVRIRPRRHRHDRHHSLDRHRQEERYHARGLRPRRREDARTDRRGGDS